ncbi:hypothetical protein PYCCODRAFT_1464821 [Trametes coccinea BRFM310]|uniref:F-box domain-containing protein n=1 Tax=Trametes coccinea (strain BRFM310) TaxID=1353009 RepID=A0A1Y2IZQ6_TRAC3|nr:hypothetical protein PYCCODRAFT_1464821 [Trametes coccinea BRFM310]
MAPVFSRQALSLDHHRSCCVPADIIIEISAFLGKSDLRAMLLCCRRFHEIVAPFLYRHLEVWFQPLGWEESEGRDHLPYRLLTTLVCSGPHPETPSSIRCYTDYVLTFRYISHNPTADLRALPLLAQFLRSARRLRHLTLDVNSQSVPLALDCLRRHHVTRVHSNSLLSECTLAGSVLPLILPSLDSIRSCKATIATALMRNRNIRTVIIDAIPNAPEMGAFLDVSSPASHLLRLSMTLPYNVPSSLSTLRAISVAFPKLQFLSLRTSAKIAEEFFEDVLALYSEEGYLLPRLQFFSLNLGGHRGNKDIMQVLEEQVVTLGKDREMLETLVFGHMMWHREHVYRLWQLSRRLTAPAPARRTHQPNIMMDAFSTPEAGLSTFEVFLLGSEFAHIDVFFAGWSPDLILCLRSLSSSMRLAIEAYCARQWSVETFFSRWFRFVPSFLKALEQCGGLVSGSEAQQFFARQEFRGRDLDIYVPLHGLLSMGRWLKAQGFGYHASAEKHPLFDVAAMMFTSHIGSTVNGPPSFPPTRRTRTFTAFNFVRASDPDQPAHLRGRHIQLIAVTCNPVEFIVNNFHSTAVMNYMTHKCAVSLFPRTTFVQKTSLICQDITRNAAIHQAWMKKYRRRGFHILGAGDPIPAFPDLRKWDRTVADSLTWVLPFERQAVVQLSPPTLEVYRFPFEVLPYFYEVAPVGAALRVAPRFMYSSMAIVANPYLELGNYRSTEIVAGFGDYFGADDDSSSDDSDDTDV